MHRKSDMFGPIYNQILNIWECMIKSCCTFWVLCNWVVPATARTNFLTWRVGTLWSCGASLEEGKFYRREEQMQQEKYGEKNEKEFKKGKSNKMELERVALGYKCLKASSTSRRELVSRRAVVAGGGATPVRGREPKGGLACHGLSRTMVINPHRWHRWTNRSHSLSPRLVHYSFFLFF